MKKTSTQLITCLALALVVAVFVAYGNVYDNPFLFDDDLLITHNKLLQSWSTFGHLLTASTMEGVYGGGGFYRPIQNVLYFLLWQTTGNDPLSFHLLNVGLHAANAVLVFFLGCRLRFDPKAAFFAALIWALHPLHTEAVTYISATADPLFVFFCLSGLIILLPDLTPKKILLSIPLFALALLSKESAVVFPALVVVCVFRLDENRLHPKTYLRTWPLWIIAIAYAWWRMTMPGLDGPQTYGQFSDNSDFDNLRLYDTHIEIRFYTFLATLPSYLSLLVWPAGLHMERSFPFYANLFLLPVLEGLGLVILAAAQIIRGRGKRGLLLSFGLLWFGAAYAPTSGLISPMNYEFLEHWMYLPSVGLFLGIAQSLHDCSTRIRWRETRPAMAASGILVAILFGALTFEQNNVWADPIIFYKNILKYEDFSPRAHANLGYTYMHRNDYPSAVAEFQKAVALTDTFAETRYDLGLALLSLPDANDHFQDAIESFRRSVEIDPTFYRSWAALAEIYSHLGDVRQAEYCRKKADETMAAPH